MIRRPFVYRRCSAVFLLGALAILPSCSTLPAFGPAQDDIIKAAAVEVEGQSSPVSFLLVNVSPATLPPEPDQHKHFPRVFTGRGFLTNEERISVSDVLELRIWESADDGLFASSGQRETVLSVNVSNSGSIDVPYAGRIDVAGRTVSEIRELLLEQYQGQAIDPEISVRIETTSARTATVLGVVRNPSLSEIPSNGIRLLDLVAKAGGVSYPTWEVELSVSRGSHSASVTLDQVHNLASNNIVILPGDTVQVSYAPRRFAVYGAVSKPGNAELNIEHPTLSTLLAEVGGLNDMQAEPNSVFVFRKGTIQHGVTSDNPVVYRLDFARPDAFFLADRFKLSKSDIIYVATADASEFRKFITTLLSPLVGGAVAIRGLEN